MARARVSHNSFTSGEWAPESMGRSDLDAYQKAAKTIENMTVFKQGGSTRRPGTRYVATAKDSSTAVRLESFRNIYGDFILEVLPGFIRFYKDGARVESGGSPVQVATPYAEGDLFELQFCYVPSKKLYIAHRDHQPRVLTCTGATSFSISTLVPDYGPYRDENTTAVTITPSATTGTVTLTASSSIFVADHVGANFRIRGGSNIGHCRITAYSSGTSVTATVTSTLPGISAYTTWSEGAWSDYRGWPGAVTMYGQRSVWGGTDSDPETVWGSKVGSSQNFDAGDAADSDAFTFTLSSGVPSSVRWLASGRHLLVGTAGGIWSMAGGDNMPLAPDNAVARQETLEPCALVSPVLSDSGLVYLNEARSRAFHFRWDAEFGMYVSEDPIPMSGHILGDGGVQLAFSRAGQATLWAACSNGEMAGVTFEPRANVITPYRQVTDGYFESVSVIPHPDGGGDQTWIVARREVGGATVRYVEYLDGVGGHYGSLQVDSGVVYSGAATDTITGLSHLEGCTVDILGNGEVYPQQVVSSGEVVGLDPEVTSAEVGLHFDSTLEPVPAEFQTGIGTAQGSKSRVTDFVLRVYQSGGFDVNGNRVSHRLSTDDAGEPAPLFTGDVRLENLGWGADNTWDDPPPRVIAQTQPLPLTVLAVIETAIVSEAP